VTTLFAIDGILAAPWALGPITFAAPAMLWGALAAAGPVVVHLVLRTKSQRVALPTVRFVAKMQRATQARQRLKHLLLLLLRTLAILLLVGALARPTLETSALSTGTRGPVEAVICLDDSASMAYRSQNRTRFDVARDMVVELLRDRARFPSGSRVALLTGSAPSSVNRLSLDVDTVRRDVEQLQVAQHDRGVGAMLDHAYALLDGGVLKRREIYVLGDQTQQSWRGVPLGAYASRRDVQVFCVDVGEEADTNFALLDVMVPDRPIPAGSVATIQLGLRSGQASGQRHLELILDGKRRWHRGPVDIGPRRVLQEAVELTGLAPGIHQGEIRIRPDDPLAVDNVRYLTVQVGAQPKVAVVGETGSEVATVVSAMLAPDALPADRQRVELIRLRTDDLGDEGLKDLTAIVLAGVRAVSSATFSRLGGYVADGGCLLVLPGPGFNPEGYAGGRGVLPAMPVEVVTLDAPTRIAPPDKTHSLLAGFRDGAELSLSAPAIRRYVRFGDPLEAAQVIVRLQTGPPAIVVRSIGQGRSIALAFAPAREWGDLAIDAAPMLVLLSEIVTGSTSGTSSTWNLRVGRPTRLPLPTPDPAATDGESRRRGEAAIIFSPTRSESWRIEGDSETNTLQTVVDECGHYRVQAAEGDGRVLMGYSINTPATESELNRAAFHTIASRFAPDVAQRVADVAELDTARTSRSTTHAMTGWLALILLAVLMAESLLSNRFYRQPAAETSEPETRE